MAEQEVSQDEQIGYHKGCLSTLTKERQELSRIVSIVDQLMQVHVQELKRLGVKVDEPEEAPVVRKGKKPIEDIL